MMLYPGVRSLTEGEGVYDGLELPGPGSLVRPFVAVNMVSSLDGRTSVDGKAAGIGSRVDRRAMRAIRSKVDAVLVGAGTVRAENVDLGLDDSGSRQPLAVVVAGSSELALADGLVSGGGDVLLVVTEGSPADRAGHPGRVRVVRARSQAPGRVDLEWLLRMLGSDYGVRRVLAEGGPGLNRSLIEAELIDEIFLTLAPKLLPGRASPIIADGAHPQTSRDLDLISIHAADNELFLRYRVRKPKEPPP